MFISLTETEVIKYQSSKFCILFLLQFMYLFIYFGEVTSDQCGQVLL